MRSFATEATKLFVEAGKAAVAQAPGIDLDDITHVITGILHRILQPGPGL
ncbi:hypothetical protein [Arthrobacter sp. 31Y]|nr:hypothetical protein [Arthrobacter sp. 31Y]